MTPLIAAAVALADADLALKLLAETHGAAGKAGGQKVRDASAARDAAMTKYRELKGV